MHPTLHRARGSLRTLGAATILASAMSLLGTAVLAQGVVTLETPAPPGSEPSAAPGATAAPPSDPQEALLAYASCMREHGVDMPDPEFTADGGVIMRSESRGEGAGDAGPVLVGGPDDPVFQEAHEACGSLMEGLVRDIDPEEQAEMQARALEFAQCMREHGVDMPDPQFDANGGVSIAIGGPDGPRIDPEAMQEAQEACGGVMGTPPGAEDTSGDGVSEPSMAAP